MSNSNLNSYSDKYKDFSILSNFLIINFNRNRNRNRNRNTNKNKFLTINSLIVIIIIITNILITFIKCHSNCGFHYIKHKSASQLKKEAKDDFNFTESEKLQNDQNDQNKRLLQIKPNIVLSPIQSIFLPIRIHFDYTTLNNQSSSFSPNLIQGLKKVLAETKDLLEKLINVKRFNNPLKVRSCDNSITISNLVKTGVDSDLVIFPFLDTTLINTTVEAYATACAISTVNKRPISGIIGFNPNFSIDRINWEAYYRNLALHELTHVLVFNPNLFEFFTNEDGKAYNKDDVIKYKNINGMFRNLLAYPKLLSAARKHFNCPSMEGVEVENQGGEGIYI